MKPLLLDHIRTELRARFDVLTRAALDAHQAATDPDSKAESKYDTRNLEASYLASGQARIVDDLAQSIRIFDALTLPTFTGEEPIQLGALVEIETDDETLFYLLVPTAGGFEVSFQGLAITLLSPTSRLFQSLLGLRVGDFLPQSTSWVSTIS